MGLKTISESCDTVNNDASFERIAWHYNIVLTYLINIGKIRHSSKSK